MKRQEFLEEVVYTTLCPPEMDSKETIDHDPVEEPYFSVENDLVCSYCAKKVQMIGRHEKAPNEKP